MDRDPATTELDLHGAATVTPAGIARAPLPIRAGRGGTGTSTRAHRLDLDGPLGFPGLVNAHDHMHVHAAPPIGRARQVRKGSGVGIGAGGDGGVKYVKAPVVDRS